MLKLKKEYINEVIKVPFHNQPILGKLIEPGVYQVIYNKAPYLFDNVCDVCQQVNCICDDYISFEEEDKPKKRKKD